MPKINEADYIETNEQYSRGIAIDRYKNEISIVSADKNKDTGDIWPNWCYPQKRANGENVPGEKAIPMKLRLGLKEQAIQRLEQLIMVIEGRGGTGEYTEDGEEIPF